MQNVTRSHRTAGGVEVNCTVQPVDYGRAIDPVLDLLDDRRGAVLSSNYEYPGRYTRWDTAIVDPPVGIEARGRRVEIVAYNPRGRPLLEMILPHLSGHPHLLRPTMTGDRIELRIAESAEVRSEEYRSRRPTVFSLIRALRDLFSAPEDGVLGLYGAFGYDLAFQFEDVPLKLPRPERQRDLVLYLPDEMLVVDHHQATAERHLYDYSGGGFSTVGVERTGSPAPYRPAPEGSPRPPAGDHRPGEYAAVVERAKEKFLRGDLFEVVPGRTFFERVSARPSQISRRLREVNPSPYSFMFNLGDNEFLVGASPEMFVRVTGRRIETCPISGTIRRGRDAIEDSEQILRLLNSEKDESELTMCSDVDRNDKSRVCEPGSVRVIGRRQIEMYSRLIHTVDHIEGRLRADMDCLDGFLSHAWAVTVTGAPKVWAMRYIEEQEKSPRVWYGGAVGGVGFDGGMNTGLTLRTVRILDGTAEVRAGATLLHDSDPAEEEAETELKASALLAAIREAGVEPGPDSDSEGGPGGEGPSVLLVDHEDSFVHTLGNYFRQCGAEVSTVRAPLEAGDLEAHHPDLVVMSPGPGNPGDFGCRRSIELVRSRSIPLFGVCLGMQAIVEAFGGRLRRLERPMHGKPSRIHLASPADDGPATPSIVFSGLGPEVTVGRYHSLCADPVGLPPELRVTAVTGDGVIMAIEHVTEPIAGVQFHPESIMSLGGEAGIHMIRNVVDGLTQGRGHHDVASRVS